MLLDLSNRLQLRGVIGRAVRFHREMEKEFQQRIEAGASDMITLHYPHLKLDAKRYFSRNAFSILFASFLEQLNLPLQRRRAYCLLTHLIRGIVTAADNIIDNENKGAVQIASMKGNVVANVSLILLQNGTLEEVLSELTSDRATIRKARQALFKAFIAIGNEESSEEAGITQVLSPEALLAEVHHYRGGQLLSLPFFIPEILEPEAHDALARYRQGMYRIGMAVQALDDITDLSIDLQSGNHNLLRSWIIHKGVDGAINDQTLRGMANTAAIDPAQSFPGATSDIVNLAIDNALAGFRIFAAQGFPIDHQGAIDLIKSLCSARGVSHLWRMFAQQQHPADAGDRHPSIFHRSQHRRPVCA